MIPAELAALVQQGRRFGIINVWRNIRADSPVLCNPLAVCQASSVSPADLVTFEIHYADRVGENYFAKHARAHQWSYFPHMTNQEVLVMKQWDSEGALAKTMRTLLPPPPPPPPPPSQPRHSRPSGAGLGAALETLRARKAAPPALLSDPAQSRESLAAALPTVLLHSAFIDPTSPADAPDRESIEVRCVVVF